MDICQLKKVHFGVLCRALRSSSQNDALFSVKCICGGLWSDMEGFIQFNVFQTRLIFYKTTRGLSVDVLLWVKPAGVDGSAAFIMWNRSFVINVYLSNIHVFFFLFTSKLKEFCPTRWEAGLDRDVQQGKTTASCVRWRLRTFLQKL